MLGVCNLVRVPDDGIHLGSGDFDDQVDTIPMVAAHGEDRHTLPVQTIGHPIGHVAAPALPGPGLEGGATAGTVSARLRAGAAMACRST